MKSEMLNNAATAVLTVCAVIITGLVVRSELSPPPASAAGQPPAERPVPQWQRLAAEGSVLGEPGAQLRIVEFSDFQCPFCATVRSRLDSLRARAPGRVAVVYRHFPLTQIHPHAVAAAVAAECAGQQGRFGTFHDALFDGQGDIGKVPWRAFAATAQVPDLARFDACVESNATAARVQADLRQGQELGIQGTPTFIFDGKMVAGLNGVTQVEAWVERMLREGK